MKRIVYVGTKEQKGDNVAQTGLIWSRGQIHEVVDDSKAKKLLEHAHVWADADQPYEMIPELGLVTSSEPKVSLIVEGEPLLDYTLAVTVDVVKKLNSGTLVPVFMTPADADAFAAWKKLEDDTAPKNTGPKKQDKETKPGLEGKKAA